MRFHIALGVLLFCIVPVYGQLKPGEPQDCKHTADTYIEIDHAIAKYGGSRMTLEGEQAHKYLEVVNNWPPPTHLKSDFLVIYYQPDGGAIVGSKILPNLDMVCIVGRVGSAVHALAIKAAQGQDT